MSENAIKSYREQAITVKKMKKSGYWEQRDLYPRMAWHDIHSAVSGGVARDVASHFVQVIYCYLRKHLL
jgi:phosphatidylserine/phosphatidylglycerophosphate/cardiolipin synthase-like enzyme